MPLTLKPEAPPLRQDADGAIRVGGTRVLLELVIRAFRSSAAPETIVEMYPTLSLPDVYSVVAYYLRHPAEIDEYVLRREREGGEVQRRLESEQAEFLTGIRARLKSGKG